MADRPALSAISPSATGAGSPSAAGAGSPNAAGIGGALAQLRGRFGLYWLAAITVAGHRFWLLPLLPLAWPGILAGTVLLGMREQSFEPAAAQNTLMGMPMAVLAVFLGVRIIAGEADNRSLEIAYTVPGGCDRVWRAKLAGAVLLLLIAEGLLALVAWFFFTPFPLHALYGALQPAVFYLVLAMGLATLFRSEIAGAMATAVVLAFNGMITGFGNQQVRISPFWNPLAAEGDPASLLAAAVQNRIGVALAILGLLALAFMRANRRERMLGG